MQMMQTTAPNKYRLPHNFTPRRYQLASLAAVDRGIKRIIKVWPRRHGKDKTGFKPPQGGDMVAFLIDRKVSPGLYGDILMQAEELREQGSVVSVLPMAKNLRHQVELLERSGYTEFKKIYRN